MAAATHMISIPEAKLRELLLEDGLLTAAQFDEAVREAGVTGKNVASVLLSRNVITENYLEELLSRYLRVPLAQIDTAKIDVNILSLLPEEVARQRRVILFKKNTDEF